MIKCVSGGGRYGIWQAQRRHFNWPALQQQIGTLRHSKQQISKVEEAQGKFDQQEVNREYGDVLQRLYRVNENFMVLKQGLENIRRLDHLLGNPSDQIKTIHVAGTNGKGSVCWKLAAALRASGYRTGLFLSPHISCFRERIRINDDLIPEKHVVELLPKIMDLAQANAIPATFFEYVTALAFQYYAKSNVDIVVLEAGLGGRLDSTNIIKQPELTIVTNVGLEHKRILGSTVEEISFEKGSIAKNGTPMLIGQKVCHDVVAEICDAVGAPLHVVPPRAMNDEFDQYLEYDKENVQCVKTALGLLGIDPENCKTALAQRPPCRFEHVIRGNRLYILDVAHNGPALEVLFETLRGKIKREYEQRRPTVQMVFALSSDKDMNDCFNVFRKNSDLLDHIYFTKAHSSRAQDPLLMQTTFQKFVPQGVKSSVLPDVESALTSATDGAPTEDTINVLCGSIFMMTEVRKCLNMKHPTDPPQ